MPFVIASGVKRKIVGVIALIVIFVILSSVIFFDRQRDSDLIDYTVQVNKLFEDAKIQFEHLRGVTLPENIKLYVYTKQQAIDSWGPVSSSLGTDSVLRQENVYKSLFLMAENETLRNAAEDWIASWTAVTVDNEIYVIYENFWPWDMPNAEAVLIHELTHVWQNNLSIPNSYDADRAQSALIEGDASYMAEYYKTQYDKSDNSDSSNRDFSVNLSYSIMDPVLLYDANKRFVYPTVSEVVQALNWFPYIEGKIFVSTIVNVYGWDRLNQCYTSGYIPSTTAQILHPEKYFTGEPAKALSALAPIDKSWTVVPSSYGYGSDTFGEYFIYLLLSQWLNNEQAQNAAVGWSGDSFSYYEKGFDFLLTWNIAWTSIQDASEFNQALIDMLNCTQATQDSNNQWFTNGRYLSLTWNPNTATTLIVCSTNQTAINPLFFTK